MIPSRGQVKTRFLHLLDDTAGAIYLKGDGAVFANALGNLTSVTVATNTATATTATAHNLIPGMAFSVIGSTVTQLNIQGTILTTPTATTFTFLAVNAPNGTYTDPIIYMGNTAFDQAFGEAYDALFNAFLLQQCPRILTIVNYHLPALTLSFTPAQAGLLDFAEPETLEERLWGSTDKYVPVEQRDKLTQRDMADALLEFVWRLDTFFFIGATTDRDIRITYDSSGMAPTSDGSLIGVDGCETFLSLYAAGVAGVRKGNDEAPGYMARAVGPRYDQGVLGGELYRIIQPRVRDRQKVQVAPKPYSAIRRTLTRRVPYIQAQQPQGVATGPAQFTTNDGTLTNPSGDGITYFLAYPVTTVNVYVNGVLQTQNLDFSFGANVVTFAGASAPPSGALITVWGWL